MKKNRSSIYMLWSLGIVVCVVISVFMLLFTSCSKGGAASEPNASPTFEIDDSTPEPVSSEPAASQPISSEPVSEPPAAGGARLASTPDMGQEYIDKFVFLGDSTTYGLKAYGVLTDGKDTKQVWTPTSGTLTLSRYNVDTIYYPDTGEEISIVDAVTKKQPEYMMITLGVNGISFMDEEWFINDYTALVQSIQAASPNTKIILNSIYPVAASYKYLSDINNDKINAANGWIEQIAENTGVKFLYSFESVVGTDGNLPEAAQNGDGIHLTGETFNTVLNYIRTHAYN